jgi:hypothetical protein
MRLGVLARAHCRKSCSPSHQKFAENFSFSSARALGFGSSIASPASIRPRGDFIQATSFTHRFGEARAEIRAAGDNPVKRRCGVLPGSDDLAKALAGISDRQVNIHASRAPLVKGIGYVASTIFKMSLDARRAPRILTVVEALKAFGNG